MNVNYTLEKILPKIHFRSIKSTNRLELCKNKKIKLHCNHQNLLKQSRGVKNEQIKTTFYKKLYKVLKNVTVL